MVLCCFLEDWLPKPQVSFVKNHIFFFPFPPFLINNQDKDFFFPTVGELFFSVVSLYFSYEKIPNGGILMYFSVNS